MWRGCSLQLRWVFLIHALQQIYSPLYPSSTVVFLDPQSFLWTLLLQNGNTSMDSLAPVYEPVYGLGRIYPKNGPVCKRYRYEPWSNLCSQTQMCIVLRLCVFCRLSIQQGYLLTRHFRVSTTKPFCYFAYGIQVLLELCKYNYWLFFRYTLDELV